MSPQPEPEEFAVDVPSYSGRPSLASSDGDPVFSASEDRRNAAELVEGLLRAAMNSPQTPQREAQEEEGGEEGEPSPSGRRRFFRRSL